MILSIVSDLHAQTSYGLHTMQLARRLPKFGVDVVLRPARKCEGLPDDIAALINPAVKPDVELILKTPTLIPDHRIPTIYFAAHESTRLRPESVQMLNRADAVCVPSDWCATVFSANGVTKPILTVPLGVSEEFGFTPFSGEAWQTKPFKFCCVANMSHGPQRKGIEKIIECFLKAFPNGEEALLNVKLHPMQALRYFEDKRVCVVDAFWTEQEYARRLATRCQCFVNVATEGFGLCPLEASRLGRPTITIGYGGVAQYLHEGNALIVSHRIVPAKDAWTGLGNWAEADDESVIEAMRYAFNHPREMQELGWKAAHSVRELTWDNHVRKLAEIVRALAKPVVAPNIQPTISADDLAFETWKRGECTEPSWKEQCVVNGWPHGEFKFRNHNPESGIVRFNPGLCKFMGHPYLFPRVAKFSNGNRTHNKIECWRLDSGMTPLEARQVNLGFGEQEDARAHVFEDTVQLSFTQLSRKGTPQQKLAGLGFALENQVWSVSPECRGNGDDQTWQKNWLWWRGADGVWRFVYDSSHCVVELAQGGEKLIPHESKMDWSFWKWGTPRGGTPPILIGDELVTFFHSVIPWMRGRNKYVTGVYAFENKPPFRITRCSREPFLIGSPNKPERIIPHSVIFVNGSVLDGDDFLLSAGCNDDSCIWVRIPQKEIEKRLVKV